MYFNSHAVILWLYLVAIYLFGIYLRYVAFTDFLLCYACKEMDSPERAYDYIVVGSGSAGSVVARRLAEDADVKILLLEAGSHGNSLLDAPAMGPLLQKTIFDWQYETVPQKQACLGLENRVSRWPMGKIVGGTAMLNNMVYTRGHPRDFARWYDGKKDYDYDADVLYYFKKSERSADSTDPSEGSAILSDLPFLTTLSGAISAAASSLGFAINDGLDCQPGFAVPKATIYRGKRRTPAHQLLDLGKRNVVLRTQTLVEKVLLKGNFEAYGVKYSYLDENYVATASKAVILAAGAIGSPKILMLSGIGPRGHLAAKGVAPKIDLPVGDNLQDHVATGLDLVLLNSSLELSLERMLSPWSALDYFLGSKGPWTTVGCENVAFTDELELMALPLGATSDDGVHLRKLVGIGEDLWRGYFANLSAHAVTVLPLVAHPRSRGTVRLKNRNPKTPPLIDPRYLSDGRDVDVLLEGIQLIKRLIGTEAMQGLGARLNDRVLPGCERHQFDTKPYWECYVRHLTITSYHPVGTCKMGEVVDYDFKVKGANRLYVVDGSVLPTSTAGNPNGAIMMMAERAADVIRRHRHLLEGECGMREVLVPRLYC